MQKRPPLLQPRRRRAPVVHGRSNARVGRVRLRTLPRIFRFRISVLRGLRFLPLGDSDADGHEGVDARERVFARDGGVHRVEGVSLGALGVVFGGVGLGVGVGVVRV